MNARAHLLRNRGLRTLLLAQVPADFADWLDFVAIGALLGFVWNAGPVAFAWLGLAIGLPYVIVGPLAGVLVDRWDLRGVLIWSNLGRAAATVALAFVGAVPALLAVAFLRSGVDAFFGPAKQAALQALVPEQDRAAANGLSHAINQASKVAGPSVGGALLVGVEPQTVFLVNAAVSATAALILLGMPRIPRARAPAAGEERPGILRDLRDGLAEVRGTPAVALALGLMAAGYFAMFLYDPLIALLVRDYGFERQVFGLAIAAVGAGGVVGAIGVGLAPGRGDGFGPIGAGCLASGGLAIVLGGALPLGAAMPPAALVVLFALLGVATALVVVPFRTILQRRVDPARIARVFAASEALNVTAILGAPFLGALIAERAGTGAPFVAGGVVMAALAGVAWTAGRRSG